MGSSSAKVGRRPGSASMHAFASAWSSIKRRVVNALKSVTSPTTVARNAPGHQQRCSTTLTLTMIRTDEE